ncbi:MAG: sugar ABC transporter permease, partial [Clostridia bacterium]|nr:sugar ABC transporter permease [Clostridia bacterium]
MERLTEKMTKDGVVRKRKRLRNGKTLQLLCLALPGIIWLIVFCYVPMGGSIVAFKNFKPKQGILGSAWNGIENFRFLFSSDAATRILLNTLFYNFLSIFIVAAVSVMIALLMDLIDKRVYLKTYQTILFLPRFISWVVVGYMATILFHYEYGLVNQLLEWFGAKPISWYLEPKPWRPILLSFNVWKTMGYTSLIYYGTIIGIDSEIYEAAEIDGAGP